MTGFLDRLPAPVRHFALIFVGAFVTTVLGVVSANVNDLSAVVWSTVLVDALGAGLASGLAGVGLAAATPLTTQYGVGATPAAGE
jgi:hypothetical protein